MDKINNRNILVDITNSGNIPNGISCDDNNPQTINDIYTNGICEGTNVEGQFCDDGDNTTVNTTYHNGICQGGNIVSDTCDDGNIQTINDEWLSDGTCVGTNVEGQSCDDSNTQTISDVYHDGVCSGIPLISLNFHDAFTNGLNYNGNIDYTNTSIMGMREEKNNLVTRGNYSIPMSTLVSNGENKILYFEIKPGYASGYFSFLDDRGLSTSDYSQLFDTNYNIGWTYYYQDLNRVSVKIDFGNKLITIKGAIPSLQSSSIVNQTFDFSNIPLNHFRFGISATQAQENWNKFYFNPNDWTLNNFN